MSVCVEKIIESETKNVWRYGRRAENGREPVEDEYSCVMVEPIREYFLKASETTYKVDAETAFRLFLEDARKITVKTALNKWIHYSDPQFVFEAVRRIKREFPEVK